MSIPIVDGARLERDARSLVIRESDVPECACPSCGKSLNAATAAPGDYTPKPGDLSVCAYCFATLSFDEQLRVRAMPDAELRALDMETCIRIGNTKRLLRRIRRDAAKTLTVEQLVREGSR